MAAPVVTDVNSDNSEGNEEVFMYYSINLPHKS